jgi:hypothetical protein
MTPPDSLDAITDERLSMRIKRQVGLRCSVVLNPVHSSMMFQPFEDVHQFYPGLILWCDPRSYEMDISTLPPNTPYDRRKATELRPCLVVSVDHQRQCFQVARLSASTVYALPCLAVWIAF